MAERPWKSTQSSFAIKVCDQRLFGTLSASISKRKDYKLIVENLWCYCYEQIRSKIWVNRCEFVAEIEKDRGLAKKDLKKRKEKVDEEFLDNDLTGEKIIKKMKKTNENDLNE
ncbi:unnamed protein product [Rhizophagus irregularis]|nr:unnamed protein product [Rhizophagus irregularis]CAB4444636.1 unnamed protein product [Rhizophagus irregularis]